MAITSIPSGDRIAFVGTYQSLETLTQSTATTPQALSVSAEVSVLGAGTATGAAVRNLYTLGSGDEGQHKLIYMAATGEASVIFTQPSGRLPISVSSTIIPSATAVDAIWASATGQYVLQAANEYIFCRWMNDAWHVLESRGATLATTT
jgi:hypothetical protein